MNRRQRITCVASAAVTVSLAGCGGSSPSPARLVSKATPTAVATPQVATPSPSASVGEAAVDLHVGTPRVRIGMVGPSDLVQDVFTPSAVTVPVGAVVEWYYDPNAAIGHNVLFKDAAELSTATIAFGERPNGTPGIPTWQVRFSVPGVYHYYCSLHQGTMQGTITVQG